MTDDRPKVSTMRRQPKQARSQERVHHILDVAEQLFIELGYEQTTTRAIATRAEVPVGSLYQFFQTKKRSRGHLPIATLSENTRCLCSFMPS